MKSKYLHNCFFAFLLSVFFFSSLNAQIGINTTTPDPSAILDINSTNKGLLAPRMTSAEKNGIINPADGLLVFDTDSKTFFYYNQATTSWVEINGGRNKFKRIKSTDILSNVLSNELAAGGGTKYLLDPGTLYEINGTVIVDFPLELNNAYVVGLDTFEDKLIKLSGDLFIGSEGGTIRYLTLVASNGNVFNLNGGGTQTFLFRELIIANSANVGVIENFGLVFSSVVQYSANANGITYRDISKLLLVKQGWLGNNTGIFETFEGTFNSLQKESGFSEVNGTAIGIDVSSNPVILSDAVMTDVVFNGTLSTGKFVDSYTSGGFLGFHFNNKWYVDCSGIPIETDGVAVGDINFDYPVGSGAQTNLTANATKLNGVTTSTNLFRFSTGGVDNRLQYLGNKKRFFSVSGSASFQSTSATTVYVFYIAKNGVVINQSKVYTNANSTSDMLAVPIQAIVELNPNDYVEVYAQKSSGGGNILTVSLNLILK